MKILYHHRTLDKEGENVHIEELIAAFRRQNHEVHVVGPSGHEDAELGWDGGLTNRIRASLPRPISEIFEYLYSWVAYRKLTKAYRQFKPDLLYERYNLFLQSGVWLKKRYGLPFVLEVNAPLAAERRNSHNLSLYRFAQHCERAVWNTADFVLPVTDELARHIERAGVAENNIRVIANGVRANAFDNTDARTCMRRQLRMENKIVVGFVGFVRQWHGLPLVLDVIRALRKDYAVHFLVIGDGDARPELESYAAKTGLSNNLTITGLVARDKISNYLAAFDVALQPNATSYASPLKLFEYMAARLAIIAPDQPNIREVLTHNQNALLFSPRDATSFRDALVTLITNPELRSKLGVEAHSTIKRRGYTWDKNARRIAHLFSQFHPVASDQYQSF